MKTPAKRRKLRVVRLRPVSEADREELVELLETELKLAKEGKTVAFAFASVDNNYGTFSGIHAPRKIATLLGGLRFLEHDILNNYADEGTEE